MAKTKTILQSSNQMKKQKVMSQMKGQDKIPEKQLDAVEIGNLPEKEFRIMIVKMIQHLGKRMEAKTGKMQEMFTNNLVKLKNKKTEINNTPEGINSRITEAEEQINDLEDKMEGSTATEQNIDKRMKRNEDSLRGPWNNIKCTNIAL